MGWIKDRGSVPQFKEGGKVKKVSKAVQSRIDASPKARKNLKKHARNIIKGGLDIITGGIYSSTKELRDYNIKAKKKKAKIKKTQKAVDKGEII